ncbi:MAG: MFS transporter [Pseudomonadota bacterium]
MKPVGEKVPARTIAAFSMAAVPVGALTTPLLVHLPPHYAGLMGLPLTTVGAIFFAVKALDILFDPAAGMVMDRTRTRIGRYRFWLLVSAPILMLATWMLFSAQRGVGSAYLAVWLVVLYLGFSLLVIAQVSWGAVLATNYNERSRVYAWSHVTGTLGAIAVLVLPSLLVREESRVVPLMGLLIVAAIPLACLIVARGVPEPVTPPRPNGDRVAWGDIPGLVVRPTMWRLLAADLLFTLGPAITSPLYLFFAMQARGYTLGEANVLLLIFTVAGVFSAPLWAAISFRFGKHRTLMAAAAAYSIIQAVVVFIPAKSFFVLAPAMFVAGGILAALGFLIRSMIADVGDEVRLETGKDRIGLLYAMITSTAKVGTASAVVVAYPLLQALGFDPAPGATNTPGALKGLVLIYSVGPVLLVMAGALVVTGYSLTRERHAGIRRQLDALDAAAAARPVVS